MNDIEHESYYPDSREVLDVVRMLHAAGLVNLSMLVERIENERAEAVDGLDEKLEEARDQGAEDGRSDAREDVERELEAARESGYDDGFSDGCKDSTRAETFARWYLKEVEEKTLERIESGDGEVIWQITDKDYDDLKNRFHSELD